MSLSCTTWPKVRALRQGSHRMRNKLFIYHLLCPLSELMITMGFPKDEVTEALLGQKYDEVMATYLLLGMKPPEASHTHELTTKTSVIIPDYSHPFQCILCSAILPSLRYYYSFYQYFELIFTFLFPF